MTVLQVLAVASEYYPLIKTGGLADVTGSLPAALAAQDVFVHTLLPGYPSVLEVIDKPAAPIHSFADLFGGPAQLFTGRSEGQALFVLDAPHLFDRPGNPYLGPDGQDWPDNALRFAALSRVAADIGTGTVGGFRPDIVHAHDWQAGLTFAYLEFGAAHRPKRVMTVHNLAFQGIFPAALLTDLGLPAAAMTAEGLEYYDQIGMLKAGLVYADRITTVSPTYAREIRTPEHGMGLDGVLRARGDVLSGILNGLDTHVWNPATDPLLPTPFGTVPEAARVLAKAALQAAMGLTVDASAPLFGVVSRLSGQKGIDLLLEALPTLLGAGGQLALLGTGDPAIEAGCRAAVAAFPGRVGCIIGYDERLAHLLHAGSDALLVPSRFEPCGLTQLCALRYGSVPVVARVGGLADTVIDANPMALAAGVATGVQFLPVATDALREAIARTIDLYRQPEIWRRMQGNGMATDVSWHASAAHYAALFRAMVAEA